VARVLVTGGASGLGLARVQRFDTRCDRLIDGDAG
jgi:NAD(P)-dependent dehydrogenase (short-subunit alcohol dehydrogenase family)